MSYPSTITRQDAIQKIQQLHFVKDSHTDRELLELIIAEYLRKTLCNLACTDSSKGLNPVYITRLKNSVRRQMGALWSGLFSIQGQKAFAIEQREESNIYPDRIQRVLETLEDLRDAIEVGNGYWLPTPVRLIQSPEKEKVFVVGGIATIDLPRILGAGVKLSGFIRYVKRRALPGPIIMDKTLWQSYEDWHGDIPNDLIAWTQDIFSKARQNLRPSASGFSNFEVYSPKAKVNPLQFFRWIHLEELTKKSDVPFDNLFLCRTVSQRLQTAPIKYWLGNIINASLKSEASVLPRDVRRLMYGLDLINDSPTKAVWEADGVITLRSWLPPEERRLFLAIGQDISPGFGRLPLRYKIESEWNDFLINTLNNLGIQIVK